MGRQAGYTIVEVLLFLALTGLLIMGVLTGFSGAISNNRKTDTTRSFESAIEAEYSRVRTGEASRPGGTGMSVCIAQTAYAGASNECLVIGKLLRFVNGSRITVHNVISDIKPDDACAATYSGGSELRCFHPRVLDMTAVTNIIQPQWQATAVRPVFQQKSNPLNYLDNVNLLAFLRHPTSGLVYIVPMSVADGTIPSTPGNPYVIPEALFNGEYINTKGQICLKHEDYPTPKTYIHFSGGEGISSIDMADGPLFTGAGAPVCS